MQKWKEYKLDQIARLVKDTFKPNAEESLPYIGLEHIEEQQLRLNSVGHSSEVISNKFYFQPNDVLFGKLRPYFRKVVQPQFKGVCSTDIWVLRAKEGFDQDFLYYFVANKDFVDLSNNADTGTRMPRADWDFMKETEWFLPESVDEQKQIAYVLKCLHEKINLLHSNNKSIENLAQTFFRQWFEEEGNAWEEKPLDEIADFLNGLACQKFPHVNGEYFSVIKIKELRTGFTDATDKASIDVPEKYIIENGEVIFSWSGSLEVVIWPFGKGILNQHLFKVTSEKYPKWFYYLWCKYHLEEFRSIANDKATTMGHIQRHHLSEALVVVPPPKVMDKMDKTMTPLIDKIISNNRQIQNLEQLRDTYLSKLMSGEARIKM